MQTLISGRLQKITQDVLGIYFYARRKPQFAFSMVILGQPAISDRTFAFFVYAAFAVWCSPEAAGSKHFIFHIKCHNTS